MPGDEGNLAVTLEDSMADTLAEIHERDDPGDLPEEIDDGKSEQHELEPDTQGRDSPESSEDEGRETKGRARDSQGRFVAAEGDEGIETFNEVLTKEIQKEGQEEGQEEVIPEVIAPIDAPEELSQAPTTWRTEAKLKWNDIDPAIRDEIVKREADMGRGISHYKQDADYGRAVQQTVQPYMAMINAAGSTPQKTIGSMLDTFYRLVNADPQQKAHLLMQVAQQHGADMSVFQNGIDPAQVEFQSQLQPLQNQISELRNELSQRDNTAQLQEQNQAQNEITAFHSALDEATGQAKYPHFEIVRTHMADLIEQAERQGREIGLEQAYENATWAIPEIRTLLMSEQTVSTEKIRQDNLKDKTNKAKNLDKINLQDKGSYDGKPIKPTGTLTDTMQETLDDIKGRDT